MRPVRYVFGLALIALSAGCAQSLVRHLDYDSLPTERRTQALTLVPDENFEVPDSTTPLAPIQMMGVLETAPGSLNLAVLDGAGLLYFSIAADGTGLKIEKHPDLPPSLDPEWVLDDIALVNLDGDALRGQLRRSLDLTEVGASRTVSQRGRLLATVAYEPSIADWQVSTLTRNDRGYQLRIERLAPVSPR